MRAIRRINRALGHTGREFADRYHAHYLASPRETRSAIRYVPNNWRHHGEHYRRPFSSFHVDPFSSAPQLGGFTDWNLGPLLELRRFPPTYEGLLVFLPRTWLLSAGWRERGGARFSSFDVPASPPSRTPRSGPSS